MCYIDLINNNEILNKVKIMKRKKIKGDNKIVIRVPVPKPGIKMKDKSKYSRKVKHANL